MCIRRIGGILWKDRASIASQSPIDTRIAIHSISISGITNASLMDINVH